MKYAFPQANLRRKKFIIFSFPRSHFIQRLPVQEVVLHDCSRTQWYKLLNDPACDEPGEVSVKIQNKTYLSGTSDHRHVHV